MKTKPKTLMQVAAEVKLLKEMKPHVRHYSIFNDNNWEKIDAVIEVLEKKMDETTIYDLQENDAEESMWKNEDLVSTACHAARWVNGEEDESPSLGWVSLIQDPKIKKKSSKKN